MQRDIIIRLSQAFKEAGYEKDEVEFWFARDLQNLLDYTEWRNFEKVIEKAKTACSNSGYKITDHFVDVNKMVKLGSGSEREIEDIILTRYAAYLIAQNGDSRKESIAFAQSYFALQSIKLETLEERILLTERLQARQKLTATETELSKNIYERGVDQQGFGRIRSKGDRALFGESTLKMKKRYGIPNTRPLADFLPTITIKAKDLATELTNFNVKKADLLGEQSITQEHAKNNKDVRKLLKKSGILPEALPPEEDIRKLERRVKADDRKFIGEIKKLPEQL